MSSLMFPKNKKKFKTYITYYRKNNKIKISQKEKQGKKITKYSKESILLEQYYTQDIKENIGKIVDYIDRNSEKHKKIRIIIIGKKKIARIYKLIKSTDGNWTFYTRSRLNSKLDDIALSLQSDIENQLILQNLKTS